MTTATMTATRPTAIRAPHDIPREWREGLLQDLMAESLVVRTVDAELRSDLVSRLRAEVRNGTYRVDGQALALAMVERAERA